MTAIPPQNAQLRAALQQAFHHHQAGRLSEAERLYRGVLQVQPNDPEVHNALGFALMGQRKPDEAAAAFRRAVAVAPDYAPGYSNLGNVLVEQSNLAEAEACYRRALALDPNMLEALNNLGQIIVASGRFAESFPLFRRYAELIHGTPANSAPGREPIPPHKVQHDQEQHDYLNAGRAAGGGAAAKFHLEEGGRIAGRAISPDSSGGEIAARWKSSPLQIAVIDNLLSDEALDKLRQYCWRSTIWLDSYSNGYLGAMPAHGFACPLLAQIVDELRGTYPAILGELPLLQWWGFKYDSQRKGVSVHADFAAVNVNIWITPDEANLDPESGGLIIWDKPAPLDWSFVEYNSMNANKMIRDFLARSGAKSVTVPYRANRAVIFDSDLFHETDRIAFREGYVNRRIGVTMLFGTRGAAAEK